MKLKSFPNAILIFRFSAMGDVALLSPVIDAILTKYPEGNLTILTKKNFVGLFSVHKKLEVIGIDFKKDYKGIVGLFKLFKFLKKQRKYSFGIDLHSNLRTFILKIFFFFIGLRFFTYDKGRKEKKNLTRKYAKVLKPLIYTITRYLLPFQKLGISLEKEAIKPSYNNFTNISDFLKQHQLEVKKEKWLGIAPFAKHATKIWSWKKMTLLIEKLQQNAAIKIFLFGGGKEELDKLREVAALFPQNIVLVQDLHLSQELNLMQKLDAMLCMDSANMHLAALVGTKIISIWGSTHPYTGFTAINQENDNIIQISPEILHCRPCSVFGNKPCWRGDHACMELITVEQVYNKLQETLNLERS